MRLHPLFAFSLLIAVNLLAFLAQGLDKTLARRGARRIPERTLLWLGVPFAAPGMWLGMRTFRHKTRKPGFLLWAGFVTLVDAGLAAALVWAWRHGWVEFGG